MARAIERALLDPVAMWDKLTPHEQRAIGVAALIHAIADDDPHADEAWNWEAALITGEAALRGAYLNLNLIDPDPPRIDLNAIGVRMCIRCGCTDHVACEDGCTWSGPRLCSRCAPPRRRKRA